MAKTDFASVEQYLASQPEPVKGVLVRVRDILRRALPGAEEVISYQIPAYKIGGQAVLYFAGWKQHYSIYPATDGVVATFERDLAPYELTKGAIRFPLAAPVPEALIEKIAKLRAREVAESLTAKATKAKPRAAVRKTSTKARTKATPVPRKVKPKAQRR